MYQVREQTKGTNPAERGKLIAEYPAYREAFRHWQRLNAEGRDAYVVRVNS